MSLKNLQQEAAEELRERVREEADGARDIIHPSDLIHEIADANVPVYTADLAAMAYEEPSLLLAEPETGPGTAGENALGYLQAAVYDALRHHLTEEWDEIRAEWDDYYEEIEILEQEIEDAEDALAELDEADEPDEDERERILDHLQDLSTNLDRARERRP